MILQETLDLLAVKFSILEKNSANPTCLTSVNIYVTKEFFISGNNESMSHTNILRRSEM